MRSPFAPLSLSFLYSADKTQRLISESSREAIRGDIIQSGHFWSSMTSIPNDADMRLAAGGQPSCPWSAFVSALLNACKGTTRYYLLTGLNSRSTFCFSPCTAFFCSYTHATPPPPFSLFLSSPYSFTGTETVLRETTIWRLGITMCS